MKLFAVTAAVSFSAVSSLFAQGSNGWAGVATAFFAQLFVLLGAIVIGYFALRNKQLDAAKKQDELLIKVDGRLTQLVDSMNKEKESAVKAATLEGEKAGAAQVVADTALVVQQAANVEPGLGKDMKEAAATIKDALAGNVVEVKKDVKEVKRDVKEILKDK